MSAQYILFRPFSPNSPPPLVTKKLGVGLMVIGVEHNKRNNLQYLVTLC